MFYTESAFVIGRMAVFNLDQVFTLILFEYSSKYTLMN